MKDGEFQINYLTNGFVGRLRAYVVIGAYPYSMITNQRVGTMLANLQIVGGNGVPHPAHGMLLTHLSSGLSIGNLTIDNRVGEVALLLLAVVHAEGRAYHEALERLDADVGITEDTPEGVFIVLNSGEQAQRVLALCEGSHGLGILAILSIDGEVGIELQGISENVAWSIDTLGTVQREVLAEGYLSVQQIVFGVSTS